MTHDEANQVANEMIRYWQSRGWTPEMAWMALTQIRDERNNALWCDCRDFMTRWLLADRGAARGRLAA